MEIVNKIYCDGEEYDLYGRQVQFIYVPQKNMEQFLKMNTERVEIFRDDAGKLYVVDKGDLDLYQNKKKKVENEFLKGISFDLF